MAELSSLPWLGNTAASLAALRLRGTHAMLLHGPAGVGKWELAMSVARDLLCESPVGAPAAAPAACGQCPSCRLFAAGNHPDLRVIVPDSLAERRPARSGEGEEPAGGSVNGTEGTAAKAKPSREIKIDQVRELSSLFGVSAHRGGARVVVLGPAEALNLPAANALLKSLEEPPPGGTFVLVSDRIDRCLPTILSRCVLLRVALPPRDAAMAWLQQQGLPADLARSRLTEAGGAPLAALRDDEDALQPELRAGLVALLRRGKALAAADIASDVPRTVPISASVALFQRWAWDYFAFRLGCGLRYHPDEGRAFEALSRDWSLAAASVWVDRLRAMRSVADHPLNARAAVEGLLLEYVASIAHGVAQ